MRQIPAGDVEGGLVAAALGRLADTLKHEIASGKARQQPIRSREYERLLEIITGGPTYGGGLLVRLGAPLDIKPMWEPLTVPPVPDAPAAGPDDNKG